jgi:hypothetical protein
MAPRQRLSSRPEDSYESTESLLAEERQQSKKIGSAPPLPTLNQTEADIARDQHDYFNLVALVSGCSVCCLPNGLPMSLWRAVCFCSTLLKSDLLLALSSLQQACIVFSTSLNYSFPWLKYTGAHFWEMWAVSLCGG